MNLLFDVGADAMHVIPLLFPEVGKGASPEGDGASGPVAGYGFLAAVEQAREEGRETGSEAVRQEFEARLRDAVETERSAVVHVCGSFARAREKYFAEVEGEVVRLALAVAARVLRREVAIDALLMAGVVRVALDKLHDAEGTVLCVPENDVDLWSAAMRRVPGLRVKGDGEMDPGECRLEAPAGVAELGVKAQLVEIERGFFDLLAKRPA